MDYAEAAKKFDEVIEFMKERDELSSSYIAMTSAIRNKLTMKAAVEQSALKNKKTK